MKKKLKKSQNISEKIVKFIIDILHLSVNEKTFNLLIQIFKFGIVGVVATLIDFIFLYLLKDICNLPLILSNTLSFSISVVYNYIASMTFVFNVDESKSKSKNFVIFVLCSIIGLMLNNLIVYIVTDVADIYHMISKVIATIFVMIFNFVTRKKFLE